MLALRQSRAAALVAGSMFCFPVFMLIEESDKVEVGPPQHRPNGVLLTAA